MKAMPKMASKIHHHSSGLGSRIAFSTLRWDDSMRTRGGRREDPKPDYPMADEPTTYQTQLGGVSVATRWQTGIDQPEARQRHGRPLLEKSRQGGTVPLGRDFPRGHNRPRSPPWGEL